MATFVLVPGFWLGGWAWRGVTEALRGAGHTVYPVTLTGLADRIHLGGPEVDLETHVTDVVNLLRYEDVSDAVLVGHSYAGNVVYGAADRVPERVAQLVYVDTWPLPEGVAQIDLMPPDARQAQEQQVATQGDGWRLPMPAWEELDQGNELRGLGDAERRLMRERATDQPFGTATQPVRLTNSGRSLPKQTAIWCSLTIEEVRQLMEAYPEVCSTLAGPDWTFLELPTSHWPMFSRPQDLGGLLSSLV